MKVKVNTVALDGINDDEFDHLVAWCGEQGFDLALIEAMPMGVDGGQSGRFLPLTQVRAARTDLKPKLVAPATYPRSNSHLGWASIRTKSSLASSIAFNWETLRSL